MRTVLITGASGFCGSHLARRLRTEGEMRIVGLSRSKPEQGDASLWDAFVRAEDFGAKEMGQLVGEIRPEWIFHLVGSAVGDEAALRAVNVTAAEHLMGAVRAHVPHAAVLVVGSAAEYGTVHPEDLPVRETHQAAPENAYGRSKLAATSLALAHFRDWGARVRVARPFNIVGAGSPTTLVTGALIERIKSVIRGDRVTVPVGNIESRRDFVAVEDVVDAYIAMMQSDCAGEIINICSGYPCPISDVIDILRRITGHPVPLAIDPALVRPGEVSVSYGSYEKARSLWGFRPKVTLERALAAAWRRATTSATTDVLAKS